MKTVFSITFTNGSWTTTYDNIDLTTNPGWATCFNNYTASDSYLNQEGTVDYYPAYLVKKIRKETILP
jgi:hypothetical protein